jgi:hypothetical protein
MYVGRAGINILIFAIIGWNIGKMSGIIYEQTLLRVVDVIKIILLPSMQLQESSIKFLLSFADCYQNYLIAILDSSRKCCV